MVGGYQEYGLMYYPGDPDRRIIGVQRVNSELLKQLDLNKSEYFTDQFLKPDRLAVKAFGSLSKEGIINKFEAVIKKREK